MPRVLICCLLLVFALAAVAVVPEWLGVVPIRATWSTGQTQEKTQFMERSLTFRTGEKEAMLWDRGTAQTAVQAVAAKDGKLQQVRWKLLMRSAEMFDPDKGEARAVELPPLPFVLEGKFTNGAWQITSQGGEAPREALDGLRDGLTVEGMFLPPRPVALGERWEVTGLAYDVAVGALHYTAVDKGSITCQFTALKLLDGALVAEITHTWDLQCRLDALTLTAKGEGTTLVRLEDDKVLSHQVSLGLTVPEQKGADGVAFSGEGFQSFSQQMAYFGTDEYPVLTPGLPEKAGVVEMPER